jgi:hypothetical protein
MSFKPQIFRDGKVVDRLGGVSALPRAECPFGGCSWSGSGAALPQHVEDSHVKRVSVPGTKQ